LTNVRPGAKFLDMHTTGRELRTLRTLSGVTVNALVAEMGVSRTTVWVMERQPIVAPEKAAQYREAIARLMQKAA
jgi:hypothetical protein